MIENTFLSSKSKKGKNTQLNDNFKMGVDQDFKGKSTAISPASVLSFDAYGNLIAGDTSHKSSTEDSSLDDFDYVIDSFETSFNSQTGKRVNCEQNGISFKKSRYNKKTMKYSEDAAEPSISHENLKLAFKSEFSSSTGLASRYGRTRKQKMGEEDFVFGAINFNEVHKITSGSPKKSRGNFENKGNTEIISSNSLDVSSIPITFEVMADKIPNFSSEDEFQNEEVKLNKTTIDRSSKKILKKKTQNSSEKNKKEKKSFKFDKNRKHLNSVLNKRYTRSLNSDIEEHVSSNSLPKLNKSLGDIEPNGKIISKFKNNAIHVKDKNSHTVKVGITDNFMVNGLINNADNNILNADSNNDVNILNVEITSKQNPISKAPGSNDKPIYSAAVKEVCEPEIITIETLIDETPILGLATSGTNDELNNPKAIKDPEIVTIKTLFDEVKIDKTPLLGLTKFGRQVKKRISADSEIVVAKEKQRPNGILKMDASVIEQNLDFLDENKEIEEDYPCQYFVGDLVWVAMGGSPIWPGLITNPKDNSNYTKICKSVKPSRIYHVQFLCDNYQVSWPKPNSILSFEGFPAMMAHLRNLQNEIKEMKEKKLKKSLKGWEIKALDILQKKTLNPKLERWHQAIEAGEKMLCLNREQRLQKFFEEKDVNNRKPSVKTKPKALKKKSEKKNNAISIAGEYKSIDGEFTGFERSSIGEDIKIKRQKLNDRLKNVDFEAYIQKHIHELMKNKVGMSKYMARKILKMRWKKLTGDKQTRLTLKHKIGLVKNKFVSKEVTVSESSTRLNDCPVEEIELEESSKGTYKVVRNEKVCFLCESVSLKPGGVDMIRCKGHCNQTFHKQCVDVNTTGTGTTVVDFKCKSCISGVHECFLCKSVEGNKTKCSVNSCGKFYHEMCIKTWPQVGKAKQAEKFVCPRHICHMCAANADNMNDLTAKTPPFTRCLRCPTTYHTGELCIAAGAEEISQSYHICTKHMKIPKNNNHHLNVNWCFCCSKGGSLLLCDQCPAAFHAECMNITAPEGSYICEDCENGKFPVYGDIVWVKLGFFRWWPGQVLHPRNIPDNIENLSHSMGMFCVHFFGSNDYYWVSRGRAFHYQEGDQGSKGNASKITEQKFQLALDTALIEYTKQNEKRKKQEESRSIKGKIKPAPWVKIDTNKPVGSVRCGKLDPSTATKCDCDPYSEAPCNSDEKCINRMLMVECLREVCPGGDRCQNQRFQKRQYPNVYPFKTSERGWGLRTKDFIKKGDFVIEYVGELIDDAEFRRRIIEMHECKEENYYFLTVEPDRLIDAGPKGNLARFMNHSCQPNCETQKWTVGEDTRVGLFAMEDISPDSEVTFNYNLECVGTEKKACHCGAPSCSGFIGAKVQKPGSSGSKKSKMVKKKVKRKSKLKATDNECFSCGTPGDLILCDMSNCPKGYHLECLSLVSLPKGKWLCPWHHCDDCGSRASKKCMMCPNSFCRSHCEGKFYSENGLENICLEHKPEEFEALRGQTEPTALQGQKIHPEQKVQSCSPDESLIFLENSKLPSPRIEEKKSTEKTSAAVNAVSTLPCGNSQEISGTNKLSRGRKRKRSRTENFNEFSSKRKEDEKLGFESEIETKKRILKSLNTNKEMAKCDSISVIKD